MNKLDRVTSAHVRRGVHIGLLSIVTSAADAAAQSRADAVSLGVSDTIRSSILAEDREIQVVVPESYYRTTISYPVLYLLDGSSRVLHGVATTRFLADARNRIPELIVVALANTNRNRDMTPGTGAATFQQVLADEIIPWVEENYRAAPDRLLMGHSLSGSFVVHTLLNRPELFSTYIASSPPLWRYEGIERDIELGFPVAAASRATVHLAVGEYENENLREGVAQFVNALRTTDPSAAPERSYVFLENEDHSSTPQRALYSGLEARYAMWRYPSFDNEVEFLELGGLDSMEAHYARASERLGFSSPPPETRVLDVARIYLEADRHDVLTRLADTYADYYPMLSEAMLNEVGRAQLRNDQVEIAIVTFIRNSERFPYSPNVHEALGDAYCRASEPARARHSYQKAVRLAADRSPQHPRLGHYQEKARIGCAN